MIERTYTTEEAAAHFGVPADTISQWKRRGDLKPCGYLRGRGPAAPLYRVDELQPLVDRWRRRTATRREKG